MNNNSYSERELNTLEYLIDYFKKEDFKFIAKLIRMEFGNIRSEKAYITRMYKILNEPIRNKIITFESLNIKHPLLKKLLKPEYIIPSPKKEIIFPQQYPISDFNDKIKGLENAFQTFHMDIDHNINEFTYEDKINKDLEKSLNLIFQEAFSSDIKRKKYKVIVDSELLN